MSYANIFNNILQNLIVFYKTNFIFTIPWIILGTFLYVMLCGQLFWRTLSVIYFIYICIDQNKGISTVNGNGSLLLRNNAFWRAFRGYFPIELVKTAELAPDRHYILANFPHGIASYGVCANISFDPVHWFRLYPGVRPKQTILHIALYVPVAREFLKLCGFISVNERSLMYHLTTKWQKDGFTSNAVAVMVGGASEAMHAHPGRYIITIKKRKGFVRVAIKSGAAIVPSFSFGENDIWEQLGGGVFSWWQRLFKKLSGITPVVVYARGNLPHPYRKRIVQVVGAPIIVTQSDNPDPVYVDEIHQKFIQALIDLFEAHKHKYVENFENVQLIIN